MTDPRILTEERLTPFGLKLTVSPGVSWSDFAPELLRAWVDEHRVLVIAGLAPLEPHLLAAASRALGPLQPWVFGSVHELKRDPNAENYLYTEHEVPLHWDGAFADAVPHWLVFRCVAAPPPEAGGETIFVDTVAVLERLPAETRERWRAARFQYHTEKKAHYGGTFTAAVIAPHPTLGVDVIRYAEPVTDLNPVSVTPLDRPASEGAALMAEIRQALYDPTVVLDYAWQNGDIVIADNHALLHGRRAFRADAPRHLLRVNVLDPKRKWWWGLRDSWRIRRPEFMRAEIPILGIPAFLSAHAWADFATVPLWEGVGVFWLLFQTGDLVNCLYDREVDLHRKTHLAEAVAALGTTNIKLQIAVSALLAIVLGAHAAWTLQRPVLVAAALVGTVLGAQYTAPPLRFKTRGLWQLVAYVGLLFVGPMAMIGWLLAEWPPLEVWFVSVLFGSVQSGILLVNNAEDLDEDEREGIQTASVALGAAGAMQTARGMCLAGGLGFLVLICRLLPVEAWGALLPFAAVLVFNDRWLAALCRSTSGVPEAQAREAIRKQGKHVPRHIEFGAWAALFAAFAVFIVRM